MTVRAMSCLFAPWFLITALLFHPVPSSAQVGPCQAVDGHASQRPNVILILTDDQDLELGSMNYMPNVNALLANQGATFDDFFVPLSLCCPSRTGILRGQYPHNHKIWTNEPPDGGFQKAYADNLEQATIATALEGAGYHTFLFGKYLNGYPATAKQTYVPPGWDEWYSPSGGDPYSEYNYQLNADGTIVSYGNAPSDYLTDVMSKEAVSFIHKIAQNPSHPHFFMHLTTFAPHRPSTPAPEDTNLFPSAQAPRTPSFNEADVSDKPAYVQALPLLTTQDVQNLDAEYRLRVQSLQAVDRMVAALVDELQADGLLGDTYIFFCSDNGYHMGQHRFLAGKYTPYETDIRVPLVVRGPNVPAGIHIDQFASNVDLAPTIAELAGVRLSDDPDGRSLVPLLEGQTPAVWRQAVLIEQIAGAVPAQVRQSSVDRQVEPPDPQDLVMESAGTDYPGHTGYRTANYKYVEYSTGERELYFLGPDPDEMENKAASASSTFLTLASAYLDTLKNCKGAGCRSAEEAAPPSPLGADFTYTPVSPTDASPVTFTASASGTPPISYTWDLGGVQATGQVVSRTFPPGTYTISVAIQDASGIQDVITKPLAVARSVKILSVKPASEPFRLILDGDGFKPACTITLDGTAVPVSSYVSQTRVIAKGSGLKAMVPKGSQVQVAVTNFDGTASAPFAFTR